MSVTPIDYDVGDPAVAPRRRVTVAELRSRRDEIYEIAARYGVSNIRVFGSVGRGDADEHSDLDLLIDVDQDHDLWDLVGFANDVEVLLGVYTKAVTVPGLKPWIRDRLVAQAVML